MELVGGGCLLQVVTLLHLDLGVVQYLECGERALNLVVDHAVPGRAKTLRPHSRKELAATVVLALPLVEASVEARSGDPVDDAADLEAGGWAGVIPLHLRATGIATAADALGHAPPADVRARVAALS